MPDTYSNFKVILERRRNGAAFGTTDDVIRAHDAREAVGEAIRYWKLADPRNTYVELFTEELPGRRSRWPGVTVNPPATPAALRRELIVQAATELAEELHGVAGVTPNAIVSHVEAQTGYVLGRGEESLAVRTYDEVAR